MVCAKAIWQDSKVGVGMVLSQLSPATRRFSALPTQANVHNMQICCQLTLTQLTWECWHSLQSWLLIGHWAEILVCDWLTLTLSWWHRGLEAWECCYCDHNVRVTTDHHPVRERVRERLSNGKMAGVSYGGGHYELQSAHNRLSKPPLSNVDKYCYNWPWHSWEDGLKYQQPRSSVQRVNFGISISLEPM